MTLNKQALRIPERKRHDWSRGVMRYCDFCTHWAITVKHEDGGNICASCCDVEYTSALKDALEVEIERADAAEKRNSVLSASLKDLIGVVNTVNRSRHHEIKMDDDDEPCYWQRKEWIEYLMETVNAAESVYRAAGIKIKGE